MAKVFLETGDDFKVVNNNTKVYGVAGDDTDSVIIETGVTGVSVNANIDRVDFAGNLADFRFEAGFGANMSVYAADGTTLLATIPLQEDANGTQLVFADGAVASIYTAGVGIATGGVALTTTPAAIAPAASEIDTTTTTAAEVTPPVTVPTFSVAASATSVIEGGDATFTVTLSEAQAAETTVTYTLAGTGTAVLGTDTGTHVPAGDTGTLTFAAGVTTQTVVVPVALDALVETGEGMTLTLSAPSAGTAIAATPSAAVAFADAPAPTFSLSSNITNGSEGQTMTITVTPSSAVLEDSVFTWGITGNDLGGSADKATAADFSQASGQISFSLGDTAAKTVEISLLDEGTVEGLEAFTLSIFDQDLNVIDSFNGSIAGQTGTTNNFTLTTAADNPALTSQDDSINAKTANTLDNGDTLIDISTTDNDTLNAFVTAAPGTVIINNVENVNITSATAAATADFAAGISGTKTFGITAINDGNGVELHSAGNGLVFNLGGTTVLGSTGVMPDLNIDAATAAGSSITLNSRNREI